MNNVVTNIGLICFLSGKLYCKYIKVHIGYIPSILLLHSYMLALLYPAIAQDNLLLTHIVWACLRQGRSQGNHTSPPVWKITIILGPLVPFCNIHGISPAFFENMRGRRIHLVIQSLNYTTIYIVMCWAVSVSISQRQAPNIVESASWISYPSKC